MKKLFFVIIFGALALSCSSDSSSEESFSNTPLAKSQYDNSNFGIYKGVFVGSSGHILINIKNEGTLSATLVINGSTYNFTTSESVTADTAIEGLTFTSDGLSFDFNVSATGYGATVSNITISGHPNANINIVKEYSDGLVVCYEGTFSGDDNGVFNIMTLDGDVYGLAKSSEDNQSFNINGAITATTISGSFTGGTFTGSVSGNTISGSWANSALETGSWSGNRKL
jgi:hypothetical protein